MQLLAWLALKSVCCHSFVKVVNPECRAGRDWPPEDGHSSLNWRPKEVRQGVGGATQKQFLSLPLAVWLMFTLSRRHAEGQERQVCELTAAPPIGRPQNRMSRVYSTSVSSSKTQVDDCCGPGAASRRAHRLFFRGRGPAVHRPPDDHPRIPANPTVQDHQERPLASSCPSLHGQTNSPRQMKWLQRVRQVGERFGR